MHEQCWKNISIELIIRIYYKTSFISHLAKWRNHSSDATRLFLNFSRFCRFLLNSRRVWNVSINPHNMRELHSEVHTDSVFSTLMRNVWFYILEAIAQAHFFATESAKISPASLIRRPYFPCHSLVLTLKQ